MKRSEAIRKYYDKISESMVIRYRNVLESEGRIQYKVYVWEDGEIEALQDAQGSNTYLVPRQMEPRQLFYVHTIESPCFDPWDFSDHAAPEDEDEREAERNEIIDWLVDEYKNNLPDALDTIIEEAEQEEACDAEYDKFNS